MKLLIKIKYHSIVDIITNSSTEIFCSIQSTHFIEEIAKELSTILGRPINVDVAGYDEEDIPNPTKQIDFWMEYGNDDDYIQSDFRKLVEHILTEKFGKENFEVFIGGW